MATDPADRVWELMEKIGICMLISRSGASVHMRPMGATVSREEDAIYFLTDVNRQKDDEIEANPDVSLAFADTSGQKYVAVNGTAVVSDDRARIRELWTPLARAWWDSADDPDIRVLRFTPHEAEYWDSPGTLATSITMIAAAVTGAKPKVGENHKLTM